MIINTNIYIEKPVSISNKMDWDKKHLIAAKHFSLYKDYNLPNHYNPIDFSMF
jgi:hypothetical protein